MVLFNSIPAQANTGPACDSLQERACSVVKPPAPAPPPGGGSGGGGGTDSGGSGGGGRGGSGGGGSGGGGSGGGEAELPDCSDVEVGHLCVSDPGPGDGVVAVGVAPAEEALELDAPAEEKPNCPHAVMKQSPTSA